MNDVTMKSTKAEIYDALQEAKRKLDQRSATIFVPGEEQEKAHQKAVVESAAKDVESGVFSEELTQKHKNLEEGISIMEKRLEEMYGIEKALQQMSIVVNAAKERQLEMEAENNRAMEEARVERYEFVRQTQEIREQMDEENENYREGLQAARKREQEEYEYERDRARKHEENEYNDKMALAQKKLETAQAEASAIEAENAAKVDEINDMRQKIENIPAELQEKYEAGYADGEKAAGKEYGYKKSMADKEHEYELREKNNDIRRLEDTVTSQASKIEVLEEKLDAAYAQIRDLAAKTVESNGSIKVINGSSDNGGSKR